MQCWGLKYCQSFVLLPLPQDNCVLNFGLLFLKVMLRGETHHVQSFPCKIGSFILIWWIILQNFDHHINQSHSCRINTVTVKLVLVACKCYHHGRLKYHKDVSDTIIFKLVPCFFNSGKRQDICNPIFIWSHAKYDNEEWCWKSCEIIYIALLSSSCHEIKLYIIFIFCSSLFLFDLIYVHKAQKNMEEGPKFLQGWGHLNENFLKKFVTHPEKSFVSYA